jgi:hypothetical protein
MVGTSQKQIFWNMLPLDKIVMNPPRVFNKNIYEMIDAFMSIKPISNKHTPRTSWIPMTRCATMCFLKN